MGLRTRYNYYRRILDAYLTHRPSQLTFWHEVPEVNEQSCVGVLGDYHMVFQSKADYSGRYDADGIPLLDYRGVLGPQYNPIAIAQYGLGNFNLYKRCGDPARFERAKKASDWLVRNLETNSWGLRVWNHHFDWDYRTRLKAPWFSGLAQGQGISLLVRIHGETGEQAYMDAAREG